MKHFEQKRKDRKRKAEIRFGKGADDGSVLVEDAWDDRVAKDLGKAFRDVGMEEVMRSGRGKGSRWMLRSLRI